MNVIDSLLKILVFVILFLFRQPAGLVIARANFYRKIKEIQNFAMF